MVFFDRGPVRSYMSKIRMDYSSGICQALKFLAEGGHREIAFISGLSTRSSSLTYQSLVIDAVQAWGLRLHSLVEGNQKLDGGIAAARTLLAQPALPTAILCHNDLTAIGAMMALQEAGIRVSEDVSVVGSDDIYIARIVRPFLTTINLSRERLGRIASEAIEKILRSKQRRGKEYVVETQLVLRQSTGPARLTDERVPSFRRPSGASA